MHRCIYLHRISVSSRLVWYQLCEFLIRRQSNREIVFPSCNRSRPRTWPRQTSSTVRSHVSPLVLHIRAEYGAYSGDSPFSAIASIYTTYRQPPSGQSEFIGSSRHCVPMAFTAKSPPEQGAAYYYSGNPMDSFLCALLFPQPLESLLVKKCVFVHCLFVCISFTGDRRQQRARLPNHLLHRCHPACGH